MAKPMTRNEVVRRRFEAKRMNSPDKLMTYVTQEALIIAAPHIKKLYSKDKVIN